MGYLNGLNHGSSQPRNTLSSISNVKKLEEIFICILGAFNAGKIGRHIEVFILYFGWF